MRGIRLSIKLPAFVVLAVVLMAVAGSLLVIFIGRSTLRTRELGRNVEAANTYASAVNSYLENARSILETIAGLSEIKDFTTVRLINPELHGIPDSVDKPKHKVAGLILKHSKIFEYVMLLQGEGSVYMLEPYDLQIKLSHHNLAFTAWYKKLMSTGKTVISDLHISAATQRPTVVIATPVRSSAGKIIGIWAGALKLEELSELGRGGLGNEKLLHYGYITDSRGLIIAHQTNLKYVEEQTDFSSVPPVRAALSGQKGTIQFINPIEREEKLGAYLPLSGSGWAVVYVIPTAIAFAPMNELVRNIILIAVVLAVFVGLVSVGFLRRITVPLNNLTAVAKKIGAGDLAQHIEVRTGDELEQLADAFNTMASALSEKEAQLLGYAENLEQTIQERTLALRENEERFRLAAESSSDLIYEWDIKERVDWFGKIDELLGYAPGEFPRTLGAWTNSVHPDDRDRVMAAVKNHLEKNEPYDIEYRIRKKDNTYNCWWARGTAVRDEKGNAYRWVGAVTDITERKRAEEAIESLAKFPSENPSPVLRVGRDGTLLYANEASYMLLHDWQLEIGRPAPLVLREAAYETLTRQTEKIIDTEHGERILSFFVAPIKNGGYANFYGRDVTERRQAEEEIRRLNEELEKRVIERTVQLQAANQELEAFSYSVSHDLRAPLRAIDGFSRILLEDYIKNLDEEGKRVLNVIRNNTQKMGQLIDDLLLFSRLGRQDISPSDISMAELAKGAFEEIKPPANERNLQFNMKTLPIAQGDRSMMKQVFANLLSNAIKFTRPKEMATIEIGGTNNGVENVYYVKDTGVGFDMQYVNKLFGVFQRLHSSEEFEGTGVGLAIVQRIIHRHGGRVWAEGKVNEGATFYFSLPAK
jgi:PAS domain S-box-containing protein